MNAYDKIMSRFEEKYIPEPNSGCWIWLSSYDERGYGRFFYEGRNSKASRVAWKLYKDTPLGAEFVCHKCDTPACVNPAHLFLGSPKDNSMDAARKGRAHRAKLKASDIPDIVALREAGEYLYSIAARYAVSETAIQHIFSGRSWTHAM